MLLGKLATELDPQAYLAILQTSNPLHQVTLPSAIVMKLEAPPAQKKMTRNEQILHKSCCQIPKTWNNREKTQPHHT